MECIKTIARINPASAVEYKTLLNSNLETLIEQGFGQNGNLLSFIENSNLNSKIKQVQNTLLMVDLKSLSTNENLFTLPIESDDLGNILDAPHELHERFEFVNNIHNETVKSSGLISLLKICCYQSQEAIPFIQKVVDTCQNSGVLLHAALAYASLGQLEKALEIVDDLNSSSNGYAKTLINMAKIYTSKDVNLTLQILEKIPF
ncbi:MAG: hypothetical protein HWD61_15745 [Parachlamydiaceae bacterium]|nr:MAG: hypothetical protein HWD61_15745 [Parachlamydiaceae bacterium]